MGFSLEKIRAGQRNLQDVAVRWTSIPELSSRAEFFVSLFEKYLSANSEVLDIGGGWGFYAAPLKKRGHHLVVLDAVKPGYQEAPVVICEPGQPIPFPDKSFDVSLMITMLHHTSDPEAVINEARRVTRKRLIVVEDIYHHALGRFWTVLRDRIYNFEYFGHPCQFKKSEGWKELFNKMGLRLAAEHQANTRLMGLSILNAVYVLEIPE